MDIQEIPEIITGISNLFGLREQGKHLVALLAKAVRCKVLCLLFLDDSGGKYTIVSCKPAPNNNPFSSFCPDIQNPLVNHLIKEKKPVTGESIKSVPSLKKQVNEDTCGLKLDEVGLIVPLMSGDRLVGMLLMGNNSSGAYTPDEVNLVSSIAEGVTPGMEKEYLREQLGEREKELSIINRCGAIITSSLDIESVYDEFIAELSQVVDIDWTALTLVEEDNLYILGLYSKIGSNWQAGDTMPVKGTPTEWVMVSKKTLVESDLKKESMFAVDVYQSKQGIRSLACVPLIVRDDEVIGSLIVGARRPDAYTQRQVDFLQEVAALVAKPVENARLYAEVLQQSRYDELTGLLNRRSMDEQIVGEINRHSRYGGVFSLIILDLDTLKAINDNYGHLAGDGLIARTGRLIEETVRSVDQAFRYGGDEFAIMLPNTAIDAAVRVSERLRKQIASSLVVDDMTVTASFGLASWPINGTEANDIIAAADGAMYEAKRLGRNRIYYDESLH